METEKRTAEEILNALEKSDTDKHFPVHIYEQDYAGGTCVYYRDDLVTKAMKEYAAQELAEYKAKLKNHLAYEHESIHISWQEMIELIDKL